MTTYDARSLSCTGLQAVIPNAGWPDNPHPEFYSNPVINYGEELERRGEDHVMHCDITEPTPCPYEPSARPEVV